MPLSTKCVTNFIEAWQARDWQKMLDNCQLTWRDSGNSATSLKSRFEGIVVKGFRIMSTNEISPVMHDVVFGLRISGEPLTMSLRVICEEAPYKPRELGHWGVNPASLKTIKRPSAA